jgi:putative membrane protein
MHHFDTWGDGWHYFPATICLVMFIIMAVCYFWFYRKRGIVFNRSWLRQNWNRDWFVDCYRSRRSDSAIELLKKRYVRGEINKEVFEQMKKDISNTE